MSKFFKRTRDEGGFWVAIHPKNVFGNKEDFWEFF